MEKVYWLISAPKTREDTFNSLNMKTGEDNKISTNFKFAVPDLKVGTLDSLMSLSDDLNKIDVYVESVTKKIAAQLFEVVESKTDKYENLTVNNSNERKFL